MNLWKIEKFIEKNLHNPALKYFSIFSIIMIPLFTYLFATKESPFDYTFSMIGNKFWYRLNFIMRWVFTGFMLTFYILRLFVLKSFSNKNARKLLVASLVLLILTVVIPAIETIPITKKIHNLLVVAFTISLTASLYIFTIYMQKTDKNSYKRSLGLFLFTIGGSLSMLFIFGMSGIFELFFFFSLAIFLLIIHMLHKIK